MHFLNECFYFISYCNLTWAPLPRQPECFAKKGSVERCSFSALHIEMPHILWLPNNYTPNFHYSLKT